MLLIRTLLASFVLIVTLSVATPGLAYIGPGLGVGAVGAVVGVIGAVVLGIAAIVYFPIKRMLRRKKEKNVSGKID